MNRQTPDAPATPGFVHLHVHDEFSFLDGMTRTAGGPARAASLGFGAHTQTNHGNLAGSFTFAHACKDNHIKPILGVEAYCAIGSRFDPQSRIVRGELATDDDTEAAKDSDDWSVEGSDVDPNSGKVKTNHHLTILAATKTGWRNLVTMMNKAQETVWYKPLIDLDLLAEHSEGLIVLTGCLGGPVAGPIAEGDMDGARAGLDALIDAVGFENVYIELMDHGTDADLDVLKGLKLLAAEYDMPMVATNDCHYTDEDHKKTHEVWLAAQSKRSIDDPKRFQFHGDGFHLRSEAEMRALWPESPEWQQACSNTVMVADRIEDWVLPDMGMMLPKFPLIPDEYDGDSAAYLHDLVVEGAIRRFGPQWSPELKARLRFEEDVIAGFGVADYFLIVWELVNWCRKQGIQVGPGRGSAAGSVTSYCLEIIAEQVEPMTNGLLFERFLEPGRVGMPDIDLDFEKNKTEAVRAHLREVYGFDCVARIGTFSTAATRKALLASSRTLLGSEGVGRKLADLVPVNGGKPMKLKDLCDPKNPAGQAFREAAEDLDCGEEVIAHAKTFEDVIDGFGIHACGVIVSPVPLVDLIPLRKEPANKHPQIAKEDRHLLPWMTEWEGPVCEKFGLLKVDVLGLRTLDAVAGTFRMAAANFDEHLTMEGIPDPDDLSNPRVRAAYDVLARGWTTGIFQLESEGITDLTKAVGPQSLADLTAIAALYRPGPMSAGSHTAYADRKQGREASTNQWTTDPEEARLIDEVFADTFNLLVYQEQIMRLAGVIAGYNAGERSKLRKAVGKKDKDIMAAVRAELVPRAVAEQFDEDGNLISPAFDQGTAEKLMDSIEACGSYLFNKSHSATYGFLSFVTAYLKANWPTEFAAATLAVTEDKVKRQNLMLAFGKEGVSVAPPNVNTSGYSTIAVDGKVSIGLSEIADVSTAAASIIAERDAGGPFTSLTDLITRVKVPAKTGEGTTALSSAVLVGLAEAGALDCLGQSRLEIVMAIYAQIDPLSGLQADWPQWESSARQRGRIGVNVGEHPMAIYADQIAEWRPVGVVDRWNNPLTIKSTPISALLDDEDLVDKRAVVTVGLLTSWKRRPYARGVLAGFTLEAADGRQVEGVMWHESLAALDTDPVPGMVIGVSGTGVRKQVVIAPAPDFDDGEDFGDSSDEERVTETVAVVSVTANQLWPLNLSEDAVVEYVPPGGSVVVDFAKARERLDMLVAAGKVKPTRMARKPAVKEAATPAAEIATVRNIQTAKPLPAAQPTLLDEDDEEGFFTSRRSSRSIDPNRSFDGSVWFSLRRGHDPARAVPLDGATTRLEMVMTIADLQTLRTSLNRRCGLFRAPLDRKSSGFAVIVFHEDDETPDADQARSKALSASWKVLPNGGGCGIAETPLARANAFAASA